MVNLPTGVYPVTGLLEDGKGETMPARRTTESRQMPRFGAARPAKVSRRIVATRLPAASKQTTLLLVRWGLTAVCLYLLVEGDSAATIWPAGLFLVTILAASNFGLARLQPATVEGVGLSVGIAVFDALLVATAWYVSGYESFTPVILSLCLLNLALVGVSLGEIAAVALAFSILYSVVGQVD